MTTKDGKRLEVETYTIPCPVPPQGISLLLARSLQAPEPLKADGRRYLCTIRIRQEITETEGVERSLPGNVDRHSLGASLDHNMLKPHVIRPQDYQVDSGDLPPMSEAPSVAVAPPSLNAPPGQKPTIEGSPWQAIQAVGLGVGNYKKVRMISRGGQGVVWQVFSQDGTVYAQKDISLKGVLWHVDFPKRLRDADREVRALKGLAWASPVIVPIIDCWITNDFEQACIVMEWLPRNMNEVLRQRRTEKRGPVPLKDSMHWFAHIAVGVAAIHSAGFIHRDLKTANILLDEHLQQCKIADLGVSRPLHRRQLDAEHGADDMASQVSAKSEKTKLSMATSVGPPRSILSGYTMRPGTNAYTSPEALESTNYGSLSDIFSLGCVLLEMLTLEMPPELSYGSTESTVPNRARELFQLPVGASAPPKERKELEDLCLWMLSPDAEERPCAKEVSMRPFMRPYVEPLMQCSRLRSMLLGNARAG